MTKLRYDNRVAVVTGGARGIGRAYAMLLASRGAKVVVNDLGGSPRGDGADASAAEETVREIKAAGGDAVACTDTVATPEGGAAIVKAALDHYGRIDILIHNAGIFRPNLVKDMPLEDYNSVLAVHQHGAFYLTKAAFPHMCKAGYGRIVLTASSLGLYGAPDTMNYSAAKISMVGFSNVLAVGGAASGVNCNVICPGAETRMTGKLVDYPTMLPEQVAPIVAWLCHESCKVSGEIYVAAGGRVARAFIAETPGVFQPSWTIEEIEAQMGTIRTTEPQVVFPVVPNGHDRHIAYNFEKIKGTKEVDGPVPAWSR